MAGRDSIGRNLVRATLTNSLAAVYTSPSTRPTQVWSMTVCNTDSASRDLTVKFGGKFVFDALPIAASETLTREFLDVLNPGEAIEAFASATAVVDIHFAGTGV